MSYPSDYTIICVFVLALHVDLIVVANGEKKKNWVKQPKSRFPYRTRFSVPNRCGFPVDNRLCCSKVSTP